jgi:hypothetical protein
VVVSSNARAHAALSAGSAIRIWVRLVALSSIVLPAAANPIPPDPSDVLAVQDSGRTGWSLPVSFSCLRSCLRTRGDHHHGLLGPHTYTEPSVIPLSSVRSRLKAVRLRASSSRTSCTGACTRTHGGAAAPGAPAAIMERWRASELGAVRPAGLAIAAGDSALSAVPLIRAALASHASVAVVAGTGSPTRRLRDLAVCTLLRRRHHHLHQLSCAANGLTSSPSLPGTGCLSASTSVACCSYKRDSSDSSSASIRSMSWSPSPSDWDMAPSSSPPARAMAPFDDVDGSNSPHRRRIELSSSSLQYFLPTFNCFFYRGTCGTTTRG